MSPRFGRVYVCFAIATMLAAALVLIWTIHRQKRTIRDKHDKMFLASKVRIDRQSFASPGRKTVAVILLDLDSLNHEAPDDAHTSNTIAHNLFQVWKTCDWHVLPVVVRYGCTDASHHASTLSYCKLGRHAKCELNDHLYKRTCDLGIVEMFERLTCVHMPAKLVDNVPRFGDKINMDFHYATAVHIALKHLQYAHTGKIDTVLAIAATNMLRNDWHMALQNALGADRDPASERSAVLVASPVENATSLATHVTQSVCARVQQDVANHVKYAHDMHARTSGVMNSLLPWFHAFLPLVDHASLVVQEASAMQPITDDDGDLGRAPRQDPAWLAALTSWSRDSVTRCRPGVTGLLTSVESHVRLGQLVTELVNVGEHSQVAWDVRKSAAARDLLAQLLYGTDTMALGLHPVVSQGRVGLPRLGHPRLQCAPRMPSSYKSHGISIAWFDLSRSCVYATLDTAVDLFGRLATSLPSNWTDEVPSSASRTFSSWMTTSLAATSMGLQVRSPLTCVALGTSTWPSCSASTYDMWTLSTRSSYARKCTIAQTLLRQGESDESGFQIGDQVQQVWCAIPAPSSLVDPSLAALLSSNQATMQERIGVRLLERHLDVVNIDDPINAPRLVSYMPVLSKMCMAGITESSVLHQAASQDQRRSMDQDALSAIAGSGSLEMNCLARYSSWLNFFAIVGNLETH